MRDQSPVLRIDPGLRLAPIGTEHAEVIFALVEDNRAALRQWLPWLDGSRALDDTIAFIESVVAQNAAGTGVVWVVEADGEPRGVCGFNSIDRTNRSGTVGYWLAEAAQRQGVMTRCVDRILRHAFEDLGLNRVSVVAAVENRRSRAVPERLGFREEGVLRQAEWLYDHFLDHVVYAILESDWRHRSQC